MRAATQGRMYYRPKDNAYVLNAVRKQASNTYQQRIPIVDQGNIQATMQNLLDNQPLWNEFHAALINRVGLEVFRTNNWTNKLGMFKKGELTYGDTVEEIAVGLAETYSYDANRDYLEEAIFGQDRLQVMAAYHKINLQRYYKVTLNRDILRRAFNDEYALSNHIQQAMTGASNSDELDEFAAMLNALREFYLAGGFHKVNVPDIAAQSSTAADSRFMLRRVRELSDTFTFLSPHYNSVGLPVFAEKSKQVLITTPEANAAMDVEALAAMFQIEKGEVPARIIVVPSWEVRIPGFVGILTTEDFWQVYDALYTTREVDNPVGLYTNYILHHHQIISVSPFVPAVLLWTGPSDTIDVEDWDVDSIAALTVTDSEGDNVTTVLRGASYELAGRAITDPEGGYNDAVRLELIGNRSTHTRIVGSTLEIAHNERAGQISIRAVAVDNNSIASTTNLTVGGDFIDFLPPVYLEDSDGDNVLEVTPDDPAFADNVITVPLTNAEFVEYRDGSTALTPGDEITITADKTITAVAKSGYELTPGATASWTFEYTA